MKEYDILLLIPFALFLYQEIKHLSRFRMFKKEGLLQSAHIIFSYQEHNGRSVYKLKIKDGGHAYSKLLKKELDVFVMEEYPYCILANPAYIGLNFFFVALIGAATVCLLYIEITGRY